MTNDLLVNKISGINICIEKINEINENKKYVSNYSFNEDSLILNLQRACEYSIDIAKFVVKENNLGDIKNSRDAFSILESNNIIDNTLANKMKMLVDFRNMAVHKYESINIRSVQIIIDKHLNDFVDYIKDINRFLKNMNK